MFDQFIKKFKASKNDWTPINVQKFDSINGAERKSTDFTLFSVDKKKVEEEFTNFSINGAVKNSKDVVVSLSQIKQKQKEDVLKTKEKNRDFTKKKNILERQEAVKKENEELANRRKTGYDEGFKKGQKAGLKEGIEEGIKQGKESGYKDGFEKGKAEGLDKGLFEGEEKGYEDGQKKAENIIKHISDISQKLENQWRDMVAVNEKKMVSLIFKIVEKVIYTKLETTPEIVKNTIMEAFKIIPDGIKAEVSISPEDYEYVQIIKEDFFKDIKKFKNIEFNSIPSINRGGCKIETKSGVVDTSIEERLDAIKQSLL